MGYQKIIDNTTNQPSKFRTKHWVEINDGLNGMYNTGSQIKFKALMIRSSLCDYSNAYILAKRTITVKKTWTIAAPNDKNKNIISKSCAPFTECINEINNKKTDHAKDNDVVIPLYNLIKYSENYSKLSENLWRYCKDEPFIDDNDNIIDPDDPDNAYLNLNKTKKNKSRLNRKWWNKICSNNGTIKTFK